MRTSYKKKTQVCAWCSKEFEGTQRAKYCCKSHSVLASRKRTGKIISPMQELKLIKLALAKVGLEFKNGKIVKNEQLRINYAASELFVAVTKGLTRSDDAYKDFLIKAGYQDVVANVIERFNWALKHSGM